jgi:hypothetical protein
LTSETIASALGLAKSTIVAILADAPEDVKADHLRRRRRRAPHAIGNRPAAQQPDGT